MLTSIRGRLLVGVVGGMSILLVGFAAIVYGVMRRSLTTSFDEVLGATARAIAAAVEQDAHRVKGDVDEREVPGLRRGAGPDYFQVWLDDGSSLVESASLKGGRLWRFAGAEDTLVYRQVRLPDGRLGRSAGLLFRVKVEEEVKLAGPAARATLVIERDTSELDRQVRFLGWFLFLGTVGTIFATGGVAAFVVSRGLGPLDRLAAAIAAIRDHDLATRVSVGLAPSEIAPVVDRLNDLLESLDAAFRRERNFTAAAAHELRTPLAGLRSAIEVTLARRRTDDEYRETLGESLDIVTHAQRMVESLLELSRLDAGQMALHPEPISLDEVVSAAFRPLADALQARGLTVTRRVGPADSCVADRAVLQMVLSAVASNAVEYTDLRGQIEVSANRSDGRTEIRVVNTGCELTDEQVRHVFERFWRGDASRGQTGLHCGLGLALVHEAMARLGGTATAEVADRRFTVRLEVPN
jgi:signal transduction histidine kinase